MSSTNIRCFIAIRLPHNVQEHISAYIKDLKKLSHDIRWTKAENIHLTIKFLGEIPADRVDAVQKALYPVGHQFSQFSLIVSRAGCFPGKKNPRVFWLGMEQGKENPLFAIHEWIEDQLIKLDFEKEKRRFSPHLTIGRLRARRPVDFSAVFNFFENQPFGPIRFAVENIFLMQSYLKSSGAEYQIIEAYDLK
jgi:2'-5' RNA ligase